MFTNVVYDNAVSGEPKVEVSFTSTLLRDMHEFHQGARLKVLFDDNGYMTVSPVGSGEEVGGAVFYHYGVVLGQPCSFAM